MDQVTLLRLIITIIDTLFYLSTYNHHNIDNYRNIYLIYSHAHKNIKQCCLFDLAAWYHYASSQNIEHFNIIKLKY